MANAAERFTISIDVMLRMQETRAALVS